VQKPPRQEGGIVCGENAPQASKYPATATSDYGKMWMKNFGVHMKQKSSV